VEERSLGEVLNGPAVLRLRPGADKEPDLFFLRRDRRERIGPERVEGPADLVVEVTSSGTRSYDLGEKAQVYREGGVAEYWVVDPERREVVVHRAGHPEYWAKAVQTGRLESTGVPGFWIEVEWCWQEPLPTAPACLRQILS
jgi:Uma2 family endonuclease